MTEITPRESRILVCAQSSIPHRSRSQEAAWPGLAPACEQSPGDRALPTWGQHRALGQCQSHQDSANPTRGQCQSHQDSVHPPRTLPIPPGQCPPPRENSVHPARTVPIPPENSVHPARTQCPSCQGTMSTLPGQRVVNYQKTSLFKPRERSRSFPRIPAAHTATLQSREFKGSASQTHKTNHSCSSSALEGCQTILTKADGFKIAS